MKHLNSGLYYVVGAYSLWGVLPLYWKELQTVPATVTLTHRVFWSLVFLSIVLWYQGNLKASFQSLLNRKLFFSRCTAAILVAINWLTYVWAMGHGYVAESGLGYFICPLLIVFIAAFVFREKLNIPQTLGMVLVGTGVAVKIVCVGHLPWVAIVLALSWALYCTIRKIQNSEPLSSLLQEVIIILPLLIVALCINDYSSLFKWYGYREMIFLILSGPVTAIPILMLVMGLKTIELRNVAIVQFLTPTLNVLVSQFLGEAFLLQDLYAYLPIWAGVLIFSGAFNFLQNKIIKREIGIQKDLHSCIVSSAEAARLNASGR